MMESYMLAINRLLNPGIPPRSRENRITAHTVMAMSPERTVLVMVEGLPGEGMVAYNGRDEINDEKIHTFQRIIEAPVGEAQEAVIPRKQLLSIITELQSDNVRIRVGGGGQPVIIAGGIEDCTVRAAIAPVIEED